MPTARSAVSLLLTLVACGRWSRFTASAGLAGAVDEGLGPLAQPLPELRVVRLGERAALAYPVVVAAGEAGQRGVVHQPAGGPQPAFQRVDGAGTGFPDHGGRHERGRCRQLTVTSAGSSSPAR